MKNNLYCFTYREEFTFDVFAKNPQEAKAKLKSAKWEMLGEPHPDYLIMEKLKEDE